MYAFAPEKPPSLVGRNFCLAILRVFAKASKMMAGSGRMEETNGLLQEAVRFCPLARKD
jgi:hypothetical protein